MMAPREFVGDDKMFVLFAAEFRGRREYSTMYNITTGLKDLDGQLLGKEMLIFKKLELISCKKENKKLCPGHQRVIMSFMPRLTSFMHRKQTHPTPGSHNKYKYQTY